MILYLRTWYLRKLKPGVRALDFNARTARYPKQGSGSQLSASQETPSQQSEMAATADKLEAKIKSYRLEHPDATYSVAKERVLDQDEELRRQVPFDGPCLGRRLNDYEGSLRHRIR